MMLTRKELEKQEYKLLAPYAMKSKETRGRVHKEKEHNYRSVYQRDKDRIIYSTAFRRLEYKTQVFVNHEGDHYRTRLTHTLEVSQLARTIARTLKLNEDLAEAIALAHDLGHTPFGHSGETALHKLMQGHGDFEHNRQGLRIVDILEKRYPNFNGLNLTWEIREGIIKHTTTYDKADQAELAKFNSDKPATLEAQTVDMADEIAYNNHDLDDGLRSGLIKNNDLMKLELWKRFYSKFKQIHPGLSDQQQRYQTVRALINYQVTDLIEETARKINKLNIDSISKVKQLSKKIVQFSPEVSKEKKRLKTFLNEKLYQHYRVTRMSGKAQRFIRKLFEVYLDKPEQLPPQSQARLKKDGPHRVICDYIAGMTDRYALNEYKKLFEPFEQV